MTVKVGFLAICSWFSSQVAFAADDSSEWVRIGAVGVGCSFSADFDVLNGYPFARLRVGDDIVALAVATGAGCRGMTYQQVPAPHSVPTYEVSVESLCMGRLPVYTITRSLSGVRERCQIAD